MLPNTYPPVVHTVDSFVLLTLRERCCLDSMPPGYDLLSIVRPLALRDEAHNGCVVRRVDKEVGAVRCSTVMWEQGEQEGAEHAPGQTWVSNHIGGGTVTVSQYVWSSHQRSGKYQVHYELGDRSVRDDDKEKTVPHIET